MYGDVVPFGIGRETSGGGSSVGIPEAIDATGSELSHEG
jgi:hypothetical protein